MRSYLIYFLYLSQNLIMKSSDSLRVVKSPRTVPHFMVLALSPSDFW